MKNLTLVFATSLALFTLSACAYDHYGSHHHNHDRYHHDDHGDRHNFDH
ncbi:hypothetical protein [Asticcacaulis sp. EMRT-3]|nr:hypothetical protein [Asticcacaulis sp. EMRT-3]MDI7775393.1 hypothetical protein [Asticcacaulis sp. EMRT-3]